MFLLPIIIAVFQFWQIVACAEQTVHGSPLLQRDFKNASTPTAPSDVLYLPEDFHNLFLFFASKLPTYPKDDDNPEEFFKFIDNSIPFTFKSFYKLSSYFVILPAKVERVSKVRGEIRVKPLLGFYFEESRNRQDVGTSFWDSMTNNWIDLELLDVLIHSTFCTLSSNASDPTGYCIELTKQKTIELFPISLDQLLEDLLKDVKETSSKSKEPKSFKIQVQRVLKLNSLRNNSTGNVVLDDKSWQERSNSLADRAKSQLQTKLIENIINSKQKVKVKSIPFKEFGLYQNPRTKSYSQVLVPNDKMLHDLGYKINGKFIKREELETIMAASEESCAPITWYNVFHNSVFGNPKMCLSNDDKSE